MIQLLALRLGWEVSGINRIMAIALILTMLCPTLSIAGEKRMSTMDRLTVLTFGHQQKRMTARPIADTEEQCPRDACMHNGCRCDNEVTCKEAECCSGDVRCDNNGYCECLGD